MVPWRLKASTAERTSRAVAFAAPIALLLYYALQDGSYDSVAWLREAIGLWLLIGVGFAVGFLPRARLPKGVLVPLSATVLLGGWTALALGWTESAERTFLELGRIAHLAAILVAAWTLLGPRTRLPAAYGLVTAGALVCVLALLSRFFPGAFPEADAGVSRLSYPLDYWNALAAWAAMSIAMAVALSAHVRERWVRAALLAVTPWCGLTLYLTYSRGGLLSGLLAAVIVLGLSRNRWVAAAHLGAALAASAAGVVTFRGYPTLAEVAGERIDLVFTAMVLAVLTAGSVGCAAVSLATLRAGGDERWRLAPRTARRGLAAAVALALVLLATLGGGTVSGAWDQFRGETGAAPVTGSDDPAARLGVARGNRSAYWSAALAAFAAEPATGIGPGTFEFWWNREGNAEFIRDAHSLYLEHLAEAGWPGLLLVSLFVLSLVALALRARFRWPAWAVRDGEGGAIGVAAATGSVTLVYAFHAGIDWLWESTAVSALALACAAVAYSPNSERAQPVGIPIRIAMTLVAAAIVVGVLLPPLAAMARFRDSQEAYRAGDIAAAEEAAADAVDAEPWAAAPYTQRALLAEVQDRLPEARRNVLEAIEREPTNWTHRVLLARIEGALGDREAAAAAFAEAVRLGPPEAELLEEPPY